MELVQTYQPPYVCIRCGSPRLPAVQFELPKELLIPTPDGKGNGRFGEGKPALCIACAEEVARIIGAMSPTDVARLIEEKAALADQVSDLLRRVLEAESQVDAALMLLRKTNPELEDDGVVDEPAPTEVAPLPFTGYDGREAVVDDDEPEVDGAAEDVDDMDTVRMGPPHEPTPDPWDAI